jgi:Lrp/AsnC family leucine-responsive transcriptional regulator
MTFGFRQRRLNEQPPFLLSWCAFAVGQHCRVNSAGRRDKGCTNVATLLIGNRVKLDRYDQQILDILQLDGRINNQDLAERIGLSPSPCLRRVRALEESGLIVGYRALLDAKKLGLSLMALIHISMDVHTPERFANFEASVSVLPEVLECLLITGQDADYQLKVAVRDMDHYQALLLNKVTRIAGVTGVHSSFVLRQVLNKTALPLASADSSAA